MLIVIEVFVVYSIFFILNEKLCSEVNVYIDKDIVIFLINNFFFLQVKVKVKGKLLKDGYFEIFVVIVCLDDQLEMLVQLSIQVNMMFQKLK